MREDITRAVAWAAEMRRVHDRLREAIEVVRHDTTTGETAAGRDLLLHCWGFCEALTGHHAGEDRLLFAAVAEDHPELTSALDRLRQDHSMIEHLLHGLRDATSRSAPPAELDRHLAGVAAVMESHFAFEERVLLAPLESLSMDADIAAVFGPLA